MPCKKTGYIAQIDASTSTCSDETKQDPDSTESYTHYDSSSNEEKTANDCDVRFLQQWGIPIDAGRDILLFATDSQKQMAYHYFNPRHDERTIEALSRFLDSCPIEKKRVPPLHAPPPPPTYVRADPGWEDLFCTPYSVFPSESLVTIEKMLVRSDGSKLQEEFTMPPRPLHIAPDALKVDLHRERRVSVQLHHERMVTIAYDGIEVSETGVSEGGYLSLVPGNLVVPTNGDYPGHSRNRFASYFFGYIENDRCRTTGWFPAIVFH